MKKLILWLVLVCSVAAAPYYPPTARFGQFQAGVLQGIPGGIPSRAGAAEYNAASYGFDSGASASTNASAFVSAANAAAAANPKGIVILPAGTFQCAQVNLDESHSGITIRGAGMTQTILKPTAQYGIILGRAIDYGSPFNAVSTITAMTAGSNVITVSDGSVFPSPSGNSTYRLGRIQLTNEIVTPVVSVNNYLKIRAPSVLMVSRSGNNITLSQPLPSNFANGIAGSTFELAVQNGLVWLTYDVGFEGFTMDGNDSGGAFKFGIYFTQTNGCWLKDVKVIGHDNYGIWAVDNVNTELRGCYVGPGLGGGSNRSGVLWNTVSYGLIEDNILISNAPCVEVNFASTSNIVSYNFLGTDLLNTNHGPQNSYNLYEGNAYWYVTSDGYFGGSSEETHMRNWSRSGLLPQNKRLTRYSNIIGNVIGVAGVTYTTDGREFWGKPNIGNNSSFGTWSLSTGSYSLDWDSSANRPYIWTGVLTTRTNNITGVVTLDSGMITTFNAALANIPSSQRNYSLANSVNSAAGAVSNVTGNAVTFTMDSISYTLPSASTVSWFSPGPNGFQELDLDVEPTTLIKANYYVMTGNIPAGESLGADTLPDSYYLTEKPAWFGTINFPAFDPYNPPVSQAAALVAIPAGWRYINGNSNYLNSTTTATVTNLSVGTIIKAP